MERREFLGALALLAAPGILLESCSRRGVFNESSAMGGDESVLLPMVGNLGVYRKVHDRFQVIRVPNTNPHSVIPNPARPRNVLVLDQVDVHATLVDLLDGKVLATCEPGGDFVFSGHGCISADGKLLYLCENFGKNLQASVRPKVPGRISVRDASTLKVLKVIPAHGAWSHNVMFMRDESILVLGYQATEGLEGEPKTGGAIAFLSAENGEVLERFQPSDPHWSLNHFDLTAAENLVVSAQTTFSEKNESSPLGSLKDLPAPILLGGMGRAQWSSQMPTALRDRMLRNHTVCVDRKRNRALIAHQLGGCVSVWDLLTQEVIATPEIQHPQGCSVSLDGSSYIVVNKAKDIVYVDAKSLQVTAKIPGQKFGLSGMDGPLHIGVLAYPS